MKQVHELWNKILTEGEERPDRTGVGTLSIFGGQVCFDLRQRFPLVTLKKTLFMSAFTEMLWFLRGENNTSYLKEHGIPIWDDWADAEGNLGPIYGVQWRKWPGKTPDTTIDQVKLLIEGIKKNPNGRRHIVTAWNPTYLSEMGLPPCHRDFQCYVSNDGHLDLMWAQRSVDTMLGLPFNIAQYALLTHMIAMVCNLKPRNLILNYGDCHIYKSHIEAAKMIIKRPIILCNPKLIIGRTVTDIDNFSIDDFSIENYQCHPFVKLPVAI